MKSIASVAISTTITMIRVPTAVTTYNIEGNELNWLSIIECLLHELSIKCCREECSEVIVTNCFRLTSVRFWRWLPER